MLVLIRDVANAESGYGFPNHLQGRSSGEIPFAKVSDISRAVEAGDRYLDGAANYVTESDAQALRAIPMPPNTVIFAKIGGAIELNRRVILARSTIVDNNVMGLSPEGDIGPAYLYYFMLTQRLGALSRATTVPSLRRGDVEGIEFPLAPTAEQSRIADALDELFSDLDVGVAALERVREKLKLYRASVLKAAVEGALTAEWRAQHPHTEPASELLKRILVERRHRWEEVQLAKFKAKGQESPKNWKAKYKEPVAPDTTDLPPLPEGWCWATVDQCASLIQYGSSAKTNGDARGIAVLRMGNLTADGRLTLDDMKYLPVQSGGPVLLDDEGEGLGFSCPHAPRLRRAREVALGGVARKRIARRRSAVGHLCLMLVGWKRAAGDCADPAGRV
jgi:type I restriction enzyme, S subunit